ncbi:hypothetical protein JHD46_07910 [Sulfurimonas sp. SAG-AH-194-C20]|nr:hypothetical protein [Sulfurimonas sp. SAG-AH-194-C20]MDF1879558.1 hypothetical protein [Sulfurimonas sp. SAG-AH-194-C20]
MSKLLKFSKEHEKKEERSLTSRILTGASIGSGLGGLSFMGERIAKEKAFKKLVSEGISDEQRKVLINSHNRTAKIGGGLILGSIGLGTVNNLINKKRSDKPDNKLAKTAMEHVGLAAAEKALAVGEKKKLPGRQLKVLRKQVSQEKKKIGATPTKQATHPSAFSTIKNKQTFLHPSASLHNSVESNQKARTKSALRKDKAMKSNAFSLIDTKRTIDEPSKAVHNYAESSQRKRTEDGIASLRREKDRVAADARREKDRVVADARREKDRVAADSDTPKTQSKLRGITKGKILAGIGLAGAGAGIYAYNKKDKGNK